MAVDSLNDVARLEEQLRITRRVLEEIRAVYEQRTARPFAEMLLREKRRSERYNHYFSIMLVSSEKVGALEMLHTSAGSLRVSDILGLVDGEGRYHSLHRAGNGLEGLAQMAQPNGDEAVGVVLPETDRDGAETVARRLRSVMAVDDEVKIGLAVYPDDGTNAEELLAMAAA